MVVWKLSKTKCHNLQLHSLKLNSLITVHTYTCKSIEKHGFKWKKPTLSSLNSNYSSTSRWSLPPADGIWGTFFSRAKKEGCEEVMGTPSTSVLRKSPTQAQTAAVPIRLLTCYYRRVQRGIMLPLQPRLCIHLGGIFSPYWSPSVPGPPLQWRPRWPCLFIGGGLV